MISTKLDQDFPGKNNFPKFILVAVPFFVNRTRIRAEDNYTSPKIANVLFGSKGKTMAKQSGIFFVDNGAGAMRITSTNDLRKRLSEWQAASPSPISVVGEITVSQTRRSAMAHVVKKAAIRQGRQIPTAYPKTVTENELLHELREYFRGRHLIGEWYRLQIEDIIDLPFDKFQARFDQIIGKANMVWQAVDAARQCVPGYHCFPNQTFDGKTWEAAMDAQIVDWLVKNGRFDITNILKFNEEFDNLLLFASDIITENESCATRDFFPSLTWLVLQGQTIFMSVLDNPLLYSVMRDTTDHDAFYVCDAVKQLFEKTPLHHMDVIALFDERIQNGAIIEDFSSWDVPRVVAEFTNP